MSSFYRFVLLFIVIGSISAKAFSQTDSLRPAKVAIFIPLYTDEVFDGAIYTLGKENLPKTVLPGLEFYNGVMMAIDSLNQEGSIIEVNIYDTKQSHQTLAQQLRSPELNNVGLIIAVISNTTELKVFSDYSVTKNIPVISATYPNYIGVTGNPNFVVLNSSFPAHLEGLYKHMQKYYNTNTITAVTKTGTTETYIKNYITQLNKTTTSIPLKIKWVTVDEKTLSLTNFHSSLDSNENNVVFVASPLESFGLKVVQVLSSTDKYIITAIGMPTWDGIKELDRKSCKNVEVVFSTPFLYYSQNKNLSSLVNSRYKDKFYSRPSDMVYKGFEATFHFSKLLSKHGRKLSQNLSDKDFTLFNEFAIVPVKIKSNSLKADLLENKKLYFIKKQQGAVKSVI